MEQSDAWGMRAAFGGDVDWSLDRLLKLIDETGIVFPLAVLTGGVFIQGLAVKVDEWAEHLDSAMDSLLGGAAGAMAREQEGLTLDDLGSVEATAGDVEKSRAEWPANGWRSLVRERRGRRADAVSRLEETAGNATVPLNSLPEDLAHAAVEMELPSLALTIRDASLFTFGGGAVTRPYVRVMTRRVDAWWPGGIDFGDAGES